MNEAMEILINEYPGSAAWETYCGAFSTSSPSHIHSGLKELSEIHLEQDIASVLLEMFSTKEMVIEWMNTKLWELDYKTPLDVIAIEDERKRNIIMRSLIMRQHIC